MSVTHPVAVRNTVCDSIVDSLDPNGKLVFHVGGTADAPGTVVATLPLSATGFGNAANGTANANAITSDSNAAGNASPVSKASLQTSGSVVKVYCDVAASASDINMSNGLTVAAGDTVSCSALSYSAMP